MSLANVWLQMFDGSLVRADISRVRAAPHPERTAAAGEVHFGFTAFTGAGEASTAPLTDGTGAGDLRELTSRAPASSGAHAR